MINFVFNNKNSFEDMNCIVVGQLTLPIVREEIELIEIEGRKGGSLTERTGNYPALVIGTKLRLVNMEDYKIKIRELTKWLNDIEDNRLYFIDNPMKCYKVKYVEFTEIQGRNTQEANFSVKFICNPFIYYTNEQMQVVEKNGDNIYNDGFIADRKSVV